MTHRRFCVGLLIILSTCLVGYPTPGPQEREQQRPRVSEKNRPPRLQPLFGENKEGRRIRVLQPGMTVTVRAHATDPDKDGVRFHWLVAKDAGTLDKTSGDVVVWTIGKSVEGIRCIAYDGRGGQARRRLTPSRHAGVLFAGQVLSDDGKLVEGATVDVNGEQTKTDKQGAFKLLVKESEVDRFILNIRRRGFGLVSRVYDKGIRAGRWTMRRATVAVVDPTQPISVQDTLSPNACLGPLSSRVNWTNYPNRAKPRFVDAAGNLTTGPLPTGIPQAVAFVRGSTQCSQGIRVGIPGNALVDASGNPPPGKVEVSLTTVDLFAPDGMPGDYTVRTEEGNRVMQSFGAGTVTVTTQDGKPLQLKKGVAAKLTIPVDPAQLRSKAKLEPMIPFLRYDEKTGDWEQVGAAKLEQPDPARASYVAQVDHLSTFNMDLIKVDQSCVKIDAAAMPNDFRLEIVIPMGTAAPVVWPILVSADPTQPNEDLHAIYNLPNNTWILLTAFEETTPGSFVPLGCYVVNTGGPQSPTDPNRPEYDYCACDSEVILSPVEPPAAIMVDGTGRRFGPLPICTYVLAQQSDGLDVYPLGDDSYYMFGLFDTGSTRVRIYNEVPYWFEAYPTWDPNPGIICNVPNKVTDANYWGSDAAYLELTGTETVRIRLNGLAQFDPSLNLPMGPPGGVNGAEVELAGVEVHPESDASNLDITLVGVPVIYDVVARIDYRSEVVKSGFEFYPGLDPGNDGGIPGFQRFTTVRGPDIKFWAANDDAIPFSDFPLKLKMGRFGAPERFLLKGVTFKNGTGNVSDSDGTNPVWFQIDTGTTITIINDAMASTLGLVPGGGTFSCLGGTNNGYIIDEVRMTGANGTYTITNAAVCWDEDSIAASAVISAVIGSNFFDQVPILFDGPRDELGIGPNTATPVTWIPLPHNCD